MDAETLRQLQRRNRVFYEVFPGTPLSDQWLENRERAEREHRTKERRAGGTDTRGGSPVNEGSSTGEGSSVRNSSSSNAGHENRAPPTVSD